MFPGNNYEIFKNDFLRWSMGERAKDKTYIPSTLMVHPFCRMEILSQCKRHEIEVDHDYRTGHTAERWMGMPIIVDMQMPDKAYKFLDDRGRLMHEGTMK